MVVFKLRTSLSAHPMSANTMTDLIFMFKEKRPLYLRHMSDIHEAAEKGVSDERERGKTAELHTSGANELKLGEGG